MSRVAFIAMLTLAFASSTKAELLFSLSTANQAAAPGAELLFSGSLTNTSTTDKLFLNDITASLTSGLMLKSNTFFANVPGILLPGESYTGPLFRVKLAVGAAAADYSGNITLQGGATIEAATNLASAAIILLATPVNQWRYLTFGTAANDAAAGDTADWDIDGDDNLLEYALGTNAKSAISKVQALGVITSDHLTLSYVPAPGATDVTHLVEVSTDLVHWSTADVEQVTPSPPGVMIFRYVPPVSLVQMAFMRLSVNR